MSKLAPFTLFNNEIVPSERATLSVASSAVLYGLSVYSVCLIKKTTEGFLAFRLEEHLERIKQSSRLVGFSGADDLLQTNEFIDKLNQLIKVNQPTTDQLCRITVHIKAEVPGVCTKNLSLVLSVFFYEAIPILPVAGANLKTSVWRRTADTAIPARAKVNGAYVNSALAKQEAIDNGFDDALFLNQYGHVSELSASNIFIVKNQTLITPDCSSDILEGITRRSIIELAKQAGLPVVERKIALTELYTADEVFACGTSASVSPILTIDKRIINTGALGPLTTELRSLLLEAQNTRNHPWVTLLLEL